MEILVSIVMGLIGAAATVYAAKIQVARKEEQHRAGEAAIAIKHPTSTSTRAQAELLEQQNVAVSLIFPGDGAFQDDDGRYSSTSVSYVSVHLDGERVGSGNGAKGFKVDFQTTVGMHDLVFLWEEDYTRNQGPRAGETRTSNSRSEVEIVCSQSGPCVIRLGYSSGNFFVRRFEPRGMGYVPLSSPTAMKLLLGGMGLIALSVLALWFLLSRR